MDYKKYDEARLQIVDILRKDLIGPVEENEIIEGNRPDETYCLGILYPQGQIQEENDEKAFVLEIKQDDNKEKGNEDTETQNESVRIENMEKQSSMGVSFNVDKETKEIEGTIKYAYYEKLKTEGKYKEKWQRIPKEVPFKFGIETKSIFIQDGLQIRINMRKKFKDGIRTVTVTILNSNIEKDRKKLTRICQQSFFQIGLNLQISGQGNFVEKKIETNYVNDDEMTSLNLLYRNNKNIAIGHGCSPMWNTEEKNIKNIWIEQLPMYISKQMIPFEDKNNYRKMSYLHTFGSEDVCKELKKFVNKYENWLKEQRNDTSLTGAETEILEKNIRKAEIICERMLETINLLSKDDDAFKAFQFMNLAMMNQMQKKGIEECNWYPFQIAFILLSIDGIIDKSNVNREIVDLLWFPTGGGKTEAYLGVIAFTIFLRRIKEVRNGRSGAGVTAIMRYTLRLLTLQQFQRAATMICSCELIRRKNVELLGNEEISIGLWVGELTENRLEDYKLDINKLKNSEGKDIYGKNPFLIKECPWCKSGIKPSQYITENPTRVEIKCSNCEFEGTLPLYIVDDEVYKYKPTLLISTIDKYARIPWEEKVREMFSLDNPNILPPELIIQDELHLISGPLGTIDGLYEIILDEFFKEKQLKPKIIASTATIRNSAEQVKALYDRESCIFPAQIKDITNSFFAIEGAEKKATRMYLGAISNNVTQTTLLIRIYADLFYAIKYLEQLGKYDEEIIDSFWTLIGYFNSIRELGGAVIQIRNDVQGRYIYLVNNKFRNLLDDEKSRMMYNFQHYEELTSRNADNSKIGEILKGLDIKYTDKEHKAYNYVLATNMISVGIDIDRLNLMIINGQPKLNAEYIQASSRVGRKTPSIVITMYNSTKSRDISHYEQFIRYHSNIYKYIEATSVTPFASMAREKALHSVIISLARHLINDMNSNIGASKINENIDKILEFKNIILKRCNNIAPDEKTQVENDINNIIDKWKGIANNLSYTKNEKKNMNKELLVYTDEVVTSTNGFKTLNSMRNVDVESNVYVKDGE